MCCVSFVCCHSTASLFLCPLLSMRVISVCYETLPIVLYYLMFELSEFD
jgi:hypothetical protein